MWKNYFQENWFLVSTIFLKFRTIFDSIYSKILMEGSKSCSDSTQKNYFIFTKYSGTSILNDRILRIRLRILNPIINGINLIKKHKRLLAALFVSANYRQGQVEWQQLSSWKKKRNTRVTSAQAARCSRSACVANGPP